MCGYRICWLRLVLRSDGTNFRQDLSLELLMAASVVADAVVATGAMLNNTQCEHWHGDSAEKAHGWLAPCHITMESPSRHYRVTIASLLRHYSVTIASLCPWRHYRVTMAMSPTSDGVTIASLSRHYRSTMTPQ